MIFHLEQFAVHQSIQLEKKKDKEASTMSDSGDPVGGDPVGGDPVANKSGKKRKCNNKEKRKSKYLKKND